MSSSSPSPSSSSSSSCFSTVGQDVQIGDILYLSDKNHIPSTSMLYGQNLGGSPFGHPVIVAGITVEGHLRLVCTVSNNGEPLKKKFPGAGVDNEFYVHRGTHVLIEPLHEDFQEWNIPDQQMANLKLDRTHDDLPRISYARIGHTFTCEREYVQLLSAGRVCKLSPGSIEAFKARPRVSVPRSKSQESAPSSPTSDDAVQIPTARRANSDGGQNLSAIRVTPWRPPLAVIDGNRRCQVVQCHRSVMSSTTKLQQIQSASSWRRKD